MPVMRTYIGIPLCYMTLTVLSVQFALYIELGTLMIIHVPLMWTNVLYCEHNRIELSILLHTNNASFSSKLVGSSALHTDTMSSRL